MKTRKVLAYLIMEKPAVVAAWARGGPVQIVGYTRDQRRAARYLDTGQHSVRLVRVEQRGRELGSLQRPRSGRDTRCCRR